jgi:hypothetical protein
MTFEEIEIAGQKHIIVDLGDGAFKSFPADPENQEYAAWLESQTEAETD